MKEILKKLYKYWMKFAHILGTINGFIILFIFYFVIIGLYALAQKSIMAFVGLKKQTRGSFWNQKTELGEGLGHLRNQF